MFWKEIDVICDNHQVANIELRVHATCSIRNKEGLDAQFVHHTYREGNFLHRITLIEVETSLHGQNIHTAQLSEDELATMSLNG